ncbi:hypothetical protein ES703_64266 [subsurface metagenome]
MQWLKEEIPNNDFLYYRIHKNWVIDGIIAPGVFRNRGKGMSTDWSKYSTPVKSRQCARKPEENGVVRMNVGEVRDIPNQIVEYSPIPHNRFHTDVYGVKDEEVRIKFRRIAKWAIKIDNF